MTDAAHRPDRFLRLPEVLRVAGLSRATIYRMIERGEFPQRVQLTERTVGWRQSDVDAWASRRATVGVSVGVSHESDAA